jgi:hypothetical protein
MIYVRNIFKQDLRDGKQIAFPKEASNVFFKFDYNLPDPDRQISFKFKEENSSSPNFSKNGKKIITRLYAAGSESRIDGELKAFLKNELNANINDIIVFKSKSDASYLFEFIPQTSNSYQSYKDILKTNNHEVIVGDSIEEIGNSNDESDIEGDIIENFADWFIRSGGSKHNYFKDSFNSSRENLLKALKKYEKEYETEFQNKVFSVELAALPDFISNLEDNLYRDHGLFHEFSAKISNHMPRAILGKQNYLKFLEEEIQNISQESFDLSKFQEACFAAGLVYSNQITERFVASLLTKPFAILTGLSGSGKTKLAQAFVQWICQSEDQYCIVPVGADWINREPLLGYINALSNDEYVLPENGALELIIKANHDIEKPYFLILDEMNLSHVERYFADFLSVMESDDTFKLHKSTQPVVGSNGVKIENEYSWPQNLFVIGTVNIDETTYMFSPKVLDRANVIEFRVTHEELDKYLTESKTLKKLNAEGATMANSFVGFAKNKTKADSKELNDALLNFFEQLKEVGAEFGYRTAAEIQFLFEQFDKINSELKSDPNTKIDIAIMQKLLPKLHGSRNKLRKVLIQLASLCCQTKEANADVFAELAKYYKQEDSLIENIKYPISLEKINRMYHNVIKNGFTSYAEA